MKTTIVLLFALATSACSAAGMQQFQSTLHSANEQIQDGDAALAMLCPQGLDTIACQNLRHESEVAHSGYSTAVLGGQTYEQAAKLVDDVVAAAQTFWASVQGLFRERSERAAHSRDVANCILNTPLPVPVPRMKSTQAPEQAPDLVPQPPQADANPWVHNPEP